MRRLPLLLVLLGLASPAGAQVYQNSAGGGSLLPSSYSLDRGTPVTGNLAALGARDGTLLQVQELSGADPLRVTFTFTGVIGFSHVSLYGRYEGSPSHEAHVEVYNVVLDTWDVFYPELISDAENRWYQLGIAQPVSAYINGGTVLVRFRHLGSGINSHNLYLDLVALGS